MSAATAPPPAPGLRHAARPPSRGLGYAVAAVAVAITVLEVLTAALAGPAADRFADAVRAGVPTADVLTPYDVVGTVIALAQALALVLTGLWLLRLRRFAERVQPHVEHARRRWWAFGGWVVPIVSFWFPFQYVRDVRDGLRPLGWTHGRLVGWWWTAFLVSQFFEGFTGGVAGAQDTGALRALPALEWFSAGLSATALTLWLLVVRRLQRSVDEVPPEVRQRTAFVPDPEAYDRHPAPPGAPLYGPGPLPPTFSPPAAPWAGPPGGPSGGPPGGRDGAPPAPWRPPPPPGAVAG